MDDSTTSEAVRLNIFNHIAHEEGFRERPYLDPSGDQVDIGFAKLLYKFPDNVMAAASKIADKRARERYLMSQVPPHLANKREDRAKAGQQLWRDFVQHRQIARGWLAKHGYVQPSGRLLDQLGMLFYGSKYGNFTNWKAAQDAVKEQDEDRVSQLASNFGRIAGRRILPVLVKRRQSERKYYLGASLPEGKEKAKKAPEAPEDFLKPFANVAENSDAFWERDAALSRQLLGEEGRKRANEVSWKLLGNDGPMPSDFDAVDYAHNVMQDLGEEVGRGYESPTFGDYMPGSGPESSAGAQWRQAPRTLVMRSV